MKQYKGFLIDDELNIYNSYTGNKISPYLGSDGYMHVSRRDGGGKKVRERLHVVVAHCFVENPMKFKYVNHIDSDKTNNYPNNLEWCTNSYNVLHGWHSGNRTHKNRTRVKVEKNGEFIGEYDSIRKLSEDLNLSRHRVARILKNQAPNNYEYEFSYL